MADPIIVPKPVPTPGASAAQTPGPEVFYNVLPTNRAARDLADTVGPAQSRLSLPAAGLLGGKLRIIIFAAIGVVVLAVAAFLIYKIIHKNPSPSNTNIDNSQQSNQPVLNTTTPTEWQQKYFGAAVCSNLSTCGDPADPDHDGLTNLEEYQRNTDPNNADSDGDGLADGDEVNVFGGNPNNNKTYDANGKYTDGDFAKGGFEITTDQKYTTTQLDEIKSKIKQYSLHQPTIATLGPDVLKQYGFVDTSGGGDNSGDSANLSGIDMSAGAKLDRDTQRSNTIKKIGSGLLKYKADKNSYPATQDFKEMVNQVKLYISVATNYTDPINKGKYVYGYQDTTGGQDFTLTYYSETQDQIIKYHETDAERDTSKESASLYDSTRINDIDTIHSALLTYSAQTIDPNSGEQYVFPTKEKYKTALVPVYLNSIPKDPKTKTDYPYSVSDSLNSFTLKSILDSPPAGKTGYQCTEDGCDYY